MGGLGRNGAQQMEAGEVVKGNLLDATGDYQFQVGKFFNLPDLRAKHVSDHIYLDGDHQLLCSRFSKRISY